MITYFFKICKLFTNYFAEVDKNLYEVSLADDVGVKAMAHYYYGATLFHLGDIERAKEHLVICDRYWSGNHKKTKEYLLEIEN